MTTHTTFDFSQLTKGQSFISKNTQYSWSIFFLFMILVTLKKIVQSSIAAECDLKNKILVFESVPIDTLNVLE